MAAEALLTLQARLSAHRKMHLAAVSFYWIVRKGKSISGTVNLPHTDKDGPEHPTSYLLGNII